MGTQLAPHGDAPADLACTAQVDDAALLGGIDGVGAYGLLRLADAEAQAIEADRSARVERDAVVTGQEQAAIEQAELHIGGVERHAAAQWRITADRLDHLKGGGIECGLQGHRQAEQAIEVLGGRSRELYRTTHRVGAKVNRQVERHVTAQAAAAEFGKALSQQLVRPRGRKNPRLAGGAEVDGAVGQPGADLRRTADEHAVIREVTRR